MAGPQILLTCGRIVLGATCALALALASPASAGLAPEEPDVTLGPALRVADTALGSAPAPLGLPGRGPGKEGKKRDSEPCWTWEQSELGFFEKINDARERHGRQRLKLDPELSKVAQHHSYHMEQADRLYHTPEEKLRERVTNWRILGENVGRGGSVESLHDAFMESPPHRENVLYRPFNYVGIGVVQEGDVMWVTILFEAYEDPGTTMEMSPTC